MSNDDSPEVPAPRDRREVVREKAQLVQARQSRARLARRISVTIGAVAVVAVAAVVVSWAFTSSGAKTLMQPANVTDDGFVVKTVAGVASESVPADAPDDEATPTPTPTPTETAAPAAADASAHPAVDIRVYVDYLSTASRDFQVANVQQLSKWVSEDAATLSYYPVAMLTAKSSGTKYSLRAAGAAACVATHSPDAFFAFNNALLTHQPDVDAAGPTDQELADLAVASGSKASKTVRTCIEKESFSMWAKSATDRALEGLPDTDDISLTSTPMVLVNGMQYVGALDDPKEFAQFVLTVASDSYYKTASPTPTPTPTATTAG